jgi:hypothetical protein
VPVVVWATAAAGVVPPVRADENTANTGIGVNFAAPWNVMTTAVPGSGPPVQATFPVPMLGIASRIACTAAAVRL